jgi:hypothetical protein
MAASGNPITSILNAITGGNSDVQQATGVTASTPGSNVAALAGGASGIASAAGAIGSAEGEIGGIWADLTDGQMWRSLGWLVLGVMLTLLGIVLLLRKPIEGIAGDVLRSGVLA